jgi:hypothetical protein
LLCLVSKTVRITIAGPIIESEVNRTLSKNFKLYSESGSVLGETDA